MGFPFKSFNAVMVFDRSGGRSPGLCEHINKPVFTTSVARVWAVGDLLDCVNVLTSPYSRHQSRAFGQWCEWRRFRSELARKYFIENA